MRDTANFKPIIKNTSMSPLGGAITYDKKYPGVSFSTDRMTDEEIMSLNGPVEVYTIDELERRKAAE